MLAAGAEPILREVTASNELSVHVQSLLLVGVTDPGQGQVIIRGWRSEEGGFDGWDGIISKENQQCPKSLSVSPLP